MHRWASDECECKHARPQSVMPSTYIMHRVSRSGKVAMYAMPWSLTLVFMMSRNLSLEQCCARAAMAVSPTLLKSSKCSSCKFVSADAKRLTLSSEARVSLNMCMYM